MNVNEWFLFCIGVFLKDWIIFGLDIKMMRTHILLR